MSDDTSAQLTQYIQTQQAAGLTKDAIVNALVNSGWNPADVDAAFAGDTPVAAPAPAPESAAPAPETQAAPLQNQAAPAQQQNAQAGATGMPDGLTEHKTMAIVGYVLPFLFFIPLNNPVSKHNPFARFHAGQQLNMLIVGIVWIVISEVLETVLFSGIGYGGMVFGLLALIISLVSLAVGVAFLALIVMGIMNVSNGQMKPLPVIGKFSLLK